MPRSARLVAVATASLLALSGCGSASVPSPPTGVDELEIPTPSLDAADFVERVDNPWLPLVAGTRWVYRTTAAGTDATVAVVVLDETREIQGLTATGVETSTAEGRGPAEVAVDWFAQDADGNVWRVGEDGSWEAGVDGAEAGLAMAAHPRVGDGYLMDYAAGVAEDRAEVLTLDGSASVPYDDLTDLLETEDSSPLEPGVVERKLYARGIGLVRAQTVDGGDELTELVSFDAP